MKLQDQCCTLEQATKLKELGVTGESYFIIGQERKEPFEAWSVEGYEDTFYNAYTVAELGEMLPAESGVIACESYYNDHLGGWYAKAMDCKDLAKETRKQPKEIYEAEAETEAEARAELLIFLLENEYVKAEEVNQKLANNGE